MKVKVVFDLENQDDRDNFAIYCKAEDMHWALWNIFHNTRKTLEHRFESIDNTNNDVFDGIDAVYEEIGRIVFDEYKINLE